MSTEKLAYFTTPIYYVNASPHLGHAYTTILGDVASRFHRLIGYETYYQTGTDEHGDKVMRAAEAQGETPQQYTDKISAQFRDLWPKLEIVHDDFIRTTEARHREVVQRILQEVYEVRLLARRPPLVPFVMRPKQEFAVILEQTGQFAGWDADAEVEVRITALIDGMITTDLDLATGTPSQKVIGMPTTQLTDQVQLSPAMAARIRGETPTANTSRQI